MSTAADDLVLQLARGKGFFRDDQLAAAEALFRANEESRPCISVLDALVRQGAWDARRNTALIAESFGMAEANLAGVTASADTLSLVPKAFAQRHQLVPLSSDALTLRVAVSDPFETEALESLALRTGLRVEASLADQADIMRAIEISYGDEHDFFGVAPQNAIGASRAPAPGTAAIETVEIADAPLIKLVEALIVEGVRRRASDIHLEPMEKRFRVRYRVDGVLIEVEGPAKRFQLAVISRLKIMANISISEKRRPGDGRIQMAVDGRSLDLRVSSLPTVHGESIVMRILDKESLKLGLPELGFLPDDQATFERLITAPDGIMLVTGPTGSGKTTTLYGCLHHINKPERKIITVEDPVEYQLTGINQVPVRQEVGMTFASALRAMLRQAPNVVMIGEIRDLETAEIAINASLTGHMVFSTLHTNDAPGAVTRLIDIGVKPYLVSTALRAVVAQRLVRKICQNCSRPHMPDPQQLRALNLEIPSHESARYAIGAGCEACHGTGFRGRMGIFEVFEVDEEIQRMIYENTSSAQMRAVARRHGMRSMREDGLRKATAGLTTIEEVVSITLGEAS